MFLLHDFEKVIVGVSLSLVFEMYRMLIIIKIFINDMLIRYASIFHTAFKTT